MHQADRYYLTEKDFFYLSSIARMHPAVAEDSDYPTVEGAAVSEEALHALRRAKDRVDEELSGTPGLSLASQIVADNRNYLDCLIDQIERSSGRQELRV